MKRLAGAVMCMALMGCQNGSADRSRQNEGEEASTSRQGPSATASTSLPSTINNWAYWSKSDPMSDKVSYFAAAFSQESVNLKFPYEGEQRASLAIRTSSKGEIDTIFRIESGQIMCSGMHAFADCEVLVRLDNEPPITVLGSKPDDGSSNVIFIRSPKIAPEILASHKTLRIEVSLYQNGTRDFSFLTRDLDLQKLHLPRN